MNKIKHVLRLAVGLAVVPMVFAACIIGLGEEPDGEVSFAEPTDGARVTSPFTVRMTATGVTVQPASAGVNEGAGHHHIIIDRELPPSGSPIPADDNHRHFGMGQTETTLDLPPGEHTLRLYFATGDHRPYDPAITDTIKITVTE